MADNELFPVPDSVAERAYVDEAGYREMYRRSIEDPEGFWGEHGKRIHWIKPYKEVRDVSYAPDDVHIRWYYDGTLNASANCLDRHLSSRGEQVAIVWEGDDPAQSKRITYNELHREVCKFANVLKAEGAKKGDRVTIYLPMIPEIAVAVLACARIGAVHSVIFGGFSPDSIAGRIQDCDSNIVVTADEGVPRRPQDPVEGQYRQGARILPDDREMHRRAAYRRRGRLARGPRRLVPRGDGGGVRGLPGRGDGRRGPAVHPLHLGVDRKAQGGAAQHRRLHGLRLDDAPIRLRLPRRRHLLVHRRCWLDHRAQLYHLRPAGQRRDHADVRGAAQLS